MQYLIIYKGYERFCKTELKSLKNVVPNNILMGMAFPQGLYYYANDDAQLCIDQLDNFRFHKNTEYLLKNIDKFYEYFNDVVEMVQKSSDINTDYNTKCHVYNLIILIDIYSDIFFTCFVKPIHDILMDGSGARPTVTKMTASLQRDIHNRYPKLIADYGVTDAMAGKFLQAPCDFLKLGSRGRLNVEFEPEDLKIAQYSCVKMNKINLLA